jgi:putative membrane protein
MSQPKKLILMGLIFFAVLAWSGFQPQDRFTWFLEIFPALGYFLILAAVYPRFKFTPLVYFLVLIHSVILMIGGKYTYTEVPLFNWIRDHFHTARNSYDGVGHFAQGFVPALLVREVLLRKTPLKQGGWLFFIVVSICLAISAFYELFEWWVSLATGSSGDAFLGTQGDVWDTQKDMALCLFGAFVALLTLSKAQDRALERLSSNSQNPIFSVNSVQK